MHTIGDMYTFLDKFSITRNSTAGHNMITHFINVQNKYTDRTTFKGVIFIWNTSDDTYTFFDLAEKTNIDSIINDQTKIFTVSHLANDPIYRIYNDLHTFNQYLRFIIQKVNEPEFFDFRMRNEKTTLELEDYEPTAVNQLSLNQHLVDYMIKLEVIGTNEKLFNAMIKREEDWLNMFFEPLRIILQQLKLTSLANDETEDEQINKQLDALVTWSSIAFVPVEQPIQTTTRSNNLLDTSFLPTDKASDKVN